MTFSKISYLNYTLARVSLRYGSLRSFLKINEHSLFLGQRAKCQCHLTRKMNINISTSWSTVRFSRRGNE